MAAESEWASKSRLVSRASERWPAAANDTRRNSALTRPNCLVGDTGFEPVTSSVSGQNLCLGVRASMAHGACAGSAMFAIVRVGWPTVWPTVNELPL